jgi:hypothetical protein
MEDKKIFTKDEILLLLGQLNAYACLNYEYVTVKCDSLILLLEELWEYKNSDEIIKNNSFSVDEISKLN